MAIIQNCTKRIIENVMSGIATLNDANLLRYCMLENIL